MINIEENLLNDINVFINLLDEKYFKIILKMSIDALILRASIRCLLLIFLKAKNNGNLVIQGRKLQIMLVKCEKRW